MRRTWGALRRRRTVVGLLLLVGLLISGPTAGANVVRHELGATSSASGAPQPSASPLTPSRPVVPTPSPTASSTPSPTPGSVPTPDPDASPLPTAGRPVPAKLDPHAVYLTFDDGPDPSWTPQILALLDRYHVPATFFQIGIEVRRHPHTAALVRQAGMRVGNHTGHHRDLTELDGAALAGEIQAGVPQATCLRPPFGAVDRKVRAAATAAGQRIVLWNVDTDDWEKPGTAKLEKRLLKQVRPGRTVLMHDGGGDRSQTLTALRHVLPVLVARGYDFEFVPGC